MDLAYKVIVCDLFHAQEPDHETEVAGFGSRAAAVEYARRRMRSSLDDMRRPGQSAEELRDQWRSFGEDCRVVGPEGPVYLASSELDGFLDRPATAAERDWLAVQP